MLIPSLGLWLAVAFLLAGITFLGCILVFNDVRYMAVDPADMWQDGRYLRALPKLLIILRTAGLDSPWPTRPSALTTYLFRRKLHKRMRGALPEHRWIVAQHLGAWAFVQLHHVQMLRFIRQQQVRRVLEILNDSLDADARAHGVAFLNECRKAEIEAARRRRPPANDAFVAHWLMRLRSVESLMNEHGYHLSKDFAILSEWENAGNAAILDRLSLAASSHAHAVLLQEGQRL